MWTDAKPLAQADPELFSAIEAEVRRQERHIELIASENYASPAMMQAQGSVLTNKYAEGYPGKRYYGGCQYVDVAERLAIERACKLFDCDYANVQPHSGAQANAAVFMALLRPGDTIMGMSLAHGGHLTHGHPANFSGKDYRVLSYGVDTASGLIDYEGMEAVARAHRPKLLIGGFSAYSRVVDWARMRRLADQIGAWLWVDMAHIAGLVAAGVYPSPLPYAHVVTSTTHKTLRGPRGGIILTKGQDDAFNRKLNSAVFPGVQGGPLMHVIAAKAVAFREALSAEFGAYQRQVVANARAMAQVFVERGGHGGYGVVSGGTDDHLFLVDLSATHVTGRDAEAALDRAHITVNKNVVPGDQRPATVTSGLRIGSPAATTRGFGEAEMVRVGGWICDLLEAMAEDRGVEPTIARIREDVGALCSRHPVYRGQELAA
ncbi:MAG: serine hydroxymethyltransferase [Gammaproteobacteria bacterium]|nr:serine hydroxymethyltransferase [Gammaproteobacteria bacterium]